ncbi:MAG TPA: DUF2341 domain-containing protein, partial [Gemmata sp.]|nr:DUF2341 domain-containing protein [Gemmata sp.]
MPTRRSRTRKRTFLIPLLAGISSALAICTTPSLARAAWYDQRWSKRLDLSIANNSSTGSLTQYQVRIVLDASSTPSLASFFSAVKPDGSDVRVTDSDGTTVVPYFIRSFSVQSPGYAEIWAKVPSLPSRSSTPLYIYYGNAKPGHFLLPPTGTFARSPTSIAPGAAENMVFDDVTQKYYQVTGEITSLPSGIMTTTIHLWSASSPGGTWSPLGQI